MNDHPFLFQLRQRVRNLPSQRPPRALPRGRQASECGDCWVVVTWSLRHSQAGILAGLTQAHISVYYYSMKRKKGELVPSERSILKAAARLRSQGVEQFHGYGIAKEIRDGEGTRLLAGHGTLYRALARLEQQGLVESAWEDPMVAANENRPRRRLYRLTGTYAISLGEEAVPTQGSSQLSWGGPP